MDVLYLDSVHNTQGNEGCVLYLFWQFHCHDIIGCSEPVRSPDGFPPTLYAVLCIYYHLIYLLSSKQQWVIFVCIWADTAGAGRPVKCFVQGLALIIECPKRYSIQ